MGNDNNAKDKSRIMGLLTSKSLYFAFFLFLLSSLYTNEISERERELLDVQQQIERQRQLADEAERRRQSAEQTKRQTQTQLNTTQRRVQELSRAEQTLRNNFEHTKNILSQTETQLSRLQFSTGETMLYLLLADQAKYKLQRSDDDTHILSLILRRTITENRRVESERRRISRDTAAAEAEFQQTLTQVSTERNRLDTISTNLRVIETEISTHERQRNEYQARASQLERDATALQALVDRLRTTTQQFTLTFPNGVQAPVRGRIIVPFGTRRHPQYNITTKSNGVVISTPENTIIRAIADGEVVHAGHFTGYGRMIIIDHKNGYHSVYGFNNSLNVRVGETVTKGQAIAESGRTGSAEAPSLHFEIREIGEAIDPLKIVNISG